MEYALQLLNTFCCSILFQLRDLLARDGITSMSKDFVFWSCYTKNLKYFEKRDIYGITSISFWPRVSKRRKIFSNPSQCGSSCYDSSGNLKKLVPVHQWLLINVYNLAEKGNILILWHPMPLSLMGIFMDFPNVTSYKHWNPFALWSLLFFFVNFTDLQFQFSAN